MLKYFDQYRNYVAAILLFSVNTDVAVMYDANIQIVMYAVQILCFTFFLRLDNKSNCDLQPLALLIAISFLVACVHYFGSETYFYKFFLFLFVYIILKKTIMRELQISYYKVAYFFAVVSLIMYVATNFFNLYSLLPISIQSGAGETYYTNYLYVIIDGWSIRNCGVFREPGVFQIYLNIALLFYYQINKHKLIDKYTFVFFVAIFTTLSSAGIVIAIGILLYQLYQQENKNFKSVFLLIIFAILAYFAIKSRFDSIFYKLQMGTKEGGSASARYYSIIIPLKMWLDYPLFGCGNAEFNELIFRYSTETGLRLSPGMVTNSITVIFATSGIFLGGICLLGTCKGVVMLCNSYKHYLFIIVVFLTMFACEGQIYTLIFNFILVAGLCKPRTIMK
jgi:hypothetical protein